MQLTSPIPVAAKRAILVLAIAFCLTPWASAPVALGLGIVLALLELTTWEKATKKYSRLLIQISIVLLGFWIDLHDVARAGAAGFGFAAGTIIATFALGALFARMLRVEGKLAALLSSGTAICGGSAIAATGAVIRASDAQMSVALGLVFILNAIALYVFPPLGHALNMSEHQFGAWSAVAIHDVASVVATAKQYGEIALQDATVIKLTRVLWLAPVCLALGWWFNRSAVPLAASPPVPTTSTQRRSVAARVFSFLPWFILGFVLASVIRTLAHNAWPDAPVDQWGGYARDIAKRLMTVALLGIGLGLSRKAIASVGVRPMLLGVLLWIVISVASYWVVTLTVA